MTNEYWAHPTKDGIYIRSDGSDLLYESPRKPKAIDGIPVVAWPDHAKIAIPLVCDADKVVTARDVVLSRDDAIRAGFKIRGADQDAPRNWRSEIMTSPEAQERPAATAELLTSRTSETLTVDQARAFLRGLPVETEQPELSENMTINEDPRAARRAEIDRSMAAFNKNRGYATKSGPQPALGNIEPAKLKRLTELRFAALYAKGQGMSQEAKTLKLALETHDKVGTPLANALTQLSVDASKLLPRI